MEINPLIPIGTKIQVDKSNIENLLQNKLLDKLPKIINGEIIDYKMTDGMDIGYVLRTEDNLKIWIFTTELNIKTKKEYNIDQTNKYNNKKNSAVMIGKYKNGFEINGNRSIKTLSNPMNLIKWLLFTFKDNI